MSEKEVTCTDCLMILNKIDVTLNLLRADLVKIIISMLGMIAAQIGVKYLGTPWYLYIMVYVSIVVSIFLVASTVYSWRQIPVLWRVLALSLAVMFSTAAGCRIWAYVQDLPMSKNMGIVMQLIQALSGVLVMVIFWRNGRLHGKGQ